MTDQFSKYLVNKDIFGYQFKVNYQGADTYQTKVGACCTIVTYVALLFNFYVLVSAFHSGSNQEEKSRFKFFDRFTAPEFALADYHTKIAFGNL